MSSSATPRGEALVVQPRWVRHVVVIVGMLALVAAMLAIRRAGDMDVEDQLYTIVTIVLGMWLLGLSAGSFVRNVRAGYALKLDARGLHIPGADVIPWSLVESADMGLDNEKVKAFRTMVVHAQGLAPVPPREAYERYVFGPLAGLKGYKGRVLVSTGLLAIEADELLAATRTFIAAGRRRAP